MTEKRNEIYIAEKTQVHQYNAQNEYFIKVL